MKRKLKVKVKEQAGSVVLQVSGEDTEVHAYAKMHSKLDRVAKKGYKEITLDVREVGFFASTALGVIVSFIREAKAKGSRITLLASPETYTYKLFELACIHKLVHHFGPAE